MANKLTPEEVARRKKDKRIEYLVRQANKTEEQLRDINKALAEVVTGSSNWDEADILTFHHTI